MGAPTSVLLESAIRQLSKTTAEAGGRVAGAFRWVSGNANGARFLKVGAALLLLAWGAVDQTRFYLRASPGRSR